MSIFHSGNTPATNLSEYCKLFQDTGDDGHASFNDMNYIIGASQDSQNSWTPGKDIPDLVSSESLIAISTQNGMNVGNVTQHMHSFSNFATIEQPAYTAKRGFSLRQVADGTAIATIPLQIRMTSQSRRSTLAKGR